jgi:uncharacterized membrane-anchored protein YitT (DUF2179 family)
MKKMRRLSFKLPAELRMEPAAAARNFLMLTAAGIVNAVGVTMFLAPVALYDSGVSGTAMLLGQLTPEAFSLSVFLILLNIPLFLFGLKRQGPLFTLSSIYAVFVYSLVSYLITYVLPIDVRFASPLAEQDLFLCAIFGGMISGTGSGLAIRFGGAMDGMEVLGVIFAKRLGLTIGTFVMVYNVLLYILIGCIKSSWILPLYSIVTYAAAQKTVDFIVEGLDKAKGAIIVTAHPKEVCTALSKEFGSGITMLDARGFFSKEERTMIYFVVNRFQIGRMRNLVYANDRQAFVSIMEISDVFGSNVKQR